VRRLQHLTRANSIERSDLRRRLLQELDQLSEIVGL
jgi:hypothetical protein